MEERRVGGVVLTGVLGRGAMGTVYLGRQVALKREVAVKTIHAERVSETWKERFLAEAQALARIAHPNVVQVYGVEEDEEGSLYLVMELVPGEPLDCLLDPDAPWPPSDVGPVVVQLADALQYVHDHEIVHRDLKPSNVHLTAEGRAILLDFGLARLAGSSLRTQEGMILGTPAFIAPEIIQGRPASPASDQYALAMTAYSLLAGAVPFADGAVQEVLLRQVHAELPPLGERNGRVSPGLEAVVRRGLAKDPAERFPAVGDFGRAFAAAAGLAGAGVEARDGSGARAVAAASLQTAGDLSSLATQARPLPPASSPGPVAAAPAAAETKVLSPGGDASAASPGPSGRTGRRLRLALVALAVAGLVVAVGLGSRGRRTTGERPARSAEGAGDGQGAKGPTPPAPGGGEAAVVATGVPAPPAAPSGAPIRVGVFTAQIGPMQGVEARILQGVTAAVDELNAAGGLLGRPLEVIVGDSTRPEAIASELGTLIDERGVQVVVGCWTSVCRRTARPVVEARGHLLLYPVANEGLEASPNILYVGPTASQHLLPALRWLLDERGPRSFFLVGADDAYAGLLVELIEDELDTHDDELDYRLLRPLDRNIHPLVEEIIEERPDAVINAFDPPRAAAFLARLRARGMTPAALPVLTLQLEEPDLVGLDTGLLAGDLVATPFVRGYVGGDGGDAPAGATGSASAEASYSAVHLWARAVERAGTPDPEAVRGRLGGIRYAAPSGDLVVAAPVHHVSRPARVAEIRPPGRLFPLWESPGPLPPDPFPPSRTADEWREGVRRAGEDWRGLWFGSGRESGFF